MNRHATREISYASAAGSRPARAMIRTVENVTGRLRLIKRADGYERDVAAGQDFWQVIADRYGLSLDCVSGSLDLIPREGPLVLVANHPYGILDGLMMGLILSKTRGDFRIMAHSVFRKAEEINRIILPISFDETREAQKLNIATRNHALEYLGQGGAIGIFPGGTVSTSAKPFSTPLDPGWRKFTAKMIAKSGAQVVPVFFEGRNSRLFQLASHAHNNLRLALLIKEFGARVDSPVRIHVGAPLAQDNLRNLAADPKAMMDFLRRSTYELSNDPEQSFEYGFEFEERHRL
ncbi:acyltransferase [Actibacterium atlanticum]|uniref:Acyltransferase n=2 Tax=Actibacterium atlanticum TaxID=1461693 RepID=A0A058ZQE8_9RHOB|nr:acyltransferase [Actibacterium atlanticum]